MKLLYLKLFILSILIIFISSIFPNLLVAAENDEFSNSSQKVPEWAMRGSLIKDMYFYPLIAIQGEDLAKCKEQGMQLAKKKVITWCWLSVAKKRTLEFIIQQMDADLDSYEQVDKATLEEYSKTLSKLSLYAVYYSYDDNKQQYTLWMLFKVHSSTVLQIKDGILKAIQSLPKDPVIVICVYKNVDKKGKSHYVYVNEIQEIIKKELIKLKYNVIDNPISEDNFENELDVNELIKSLQTLLENTKIKTVFWCNLDKKNIIIKTVKRKKGHQKGYATLLIRQINLTNGSVIKNVFKEEIAVHDLMSDKSIEAAYELLKSKLKITDDEIDPQE